MNKIIFLTSVMFFSLFTHSVKAEETFQNQINQNEDVEEMFEYAEINRSLLEDRNIVLLSSVSNQTTEIQTDTYEYLPDAFDYGNIHNRTYVVGVHTLNKNKSSSEMDPSYSYYGYLNVRYNDTVENGETKYLITHISGGWEQKDSSVSISNRKLTYACTHRLNTRQYRSINIITNSFDRATGFTQYATDDGVSTLVGAVSEATLTHGSSYVFEISVGICMRTLPSWW